MQPLNSRNLSLEIMADLNQVIQEEGFTLDSLAEAVVRLSHMFTKARHTLTRHYFDDPLLASAYLEYFFPVNFAKVGVLLDEMPAPFVTNHLSVLDVGSGPGTGGLALLDWWHRINIARELVVTAVDRSPGALRYANRLWQMFCDAEGRTNARLDLVEGDIERAGCLERIRANGPYDVIILANSLNEIATASGDPLVIKVQMLANLLELLSSHGTVMIIEPALRETSRALSQVRDQLIESGLCNVYSPCLHENECPALVNRYDWCHEERGWDPPESIQAIDAQVGFIKDSLKFSYLLLRKDGKTIVNRQPNVYRVVSELRVMKGEKRAWLCNELGRQEVGRQDRLATDQNAAFDEWHRGDIVQIKKISHKERHGKVSELGRIDQSSDVKIIRSA